MPAPGQYQIIDEREGTRAKPPWDPRGLFLLSILFAPVGIAWSAVNWGRMERREKVWPTVGLAIAMAALPLVLSLASSSLIYVFSVSKEELRSGLGTFKTLVQFLVCFWIFRGQYPLFQVLTERRPKANSLWIWGAAIGLILFIVALSFLVKALRY